MYFRPNIMVGRIKRLKCLHVCHFIIFLTLSFITLVLINSRSSNGTALSDQDRSPWNQIATVIKTGDFIAATRINTEQASTEVTACVVDPALIECDGNRFSDILCITFVYAGSYLQMPSLRKRHAYRILAELQFRMLKRPKCEFLEMVL